MIFMHLKVPRVEAVEAAVQAQYLFEYWLLLG